MKKIFQLINPRNILLTPSTRIASDIYLVSYPKSGNTWLRFLVANALKLHYESERSVNFFSISDIIPDVQISRNISLNPAFDDNTLPRIIKSHCAYNPYYKRIVLLVRDPRDVMVSYYFHLMSHGTIPSSLKFSKFIRSYRFGVKTWERHTNSWLKNRVNGQNLHIFTYENLSESTSETLYRILDLIGFSISMDLIEKAVQISSFENMKKLEHSTRPVLLVKQQSIPFVRSAKVSRGSKIDESDKRYIDCIVKGTLEEIESLVDIY
jgi:hypothetical protein